MLYIVVPTFNRNEIFHEFIRQLQMQTYQDYRVVAVDHGTKKVEGEWPKVTILNGEPSLWWTGAINMAINHVLALDCLKNTDHILVINDDITIDKRYLEKVDKAIALKPNACIGSLCYDLNTNKIKHLNMHINYLKACYDYNLKGKNRESLKEPFYESDVLKGRGTVFPVSILKQIGIYNDARLPHYRADHELAWRAKMRGFEVVVSSEMCIGAILNSPHEIDKKLGIARNYKNIFMHRVSTRNTKDLWNYAFVCFNPLYAFYFSVINMVRDHLFFLIQYYK